jgi:hypothetical protein
MIQSEFPSARHGEQKTKWRSAILDPKGILERNCKKSIEDLPSPCVGLPPLAAIVKKGNESMHQTK